MPETLPFTPRCFLFLQGPHGPFFDQLARQLRRSGARTLRVGFNAGDRAFWRDPSRYISFTGSLSEWPEALAALLTEHQITDLVIYGDTRAIHAKAVALARARNLTVHTFEEGYLRPYWVTYEHNGTNGHSDLMDMSIAQMAMQLDQQKTDRPVPPGHWGDMRQHVFYGALYHWFVLFWNKKYPQFKPHRALNVGQEFQLYLKRLLLMPLHALGRILATYRIRRGSFPYHIALLQLEHDSAFQAHSPYGTQAAFVADVIEGFARGAPPHHHLVFKAHPLEDGRAPLQRTLHHCAKAAGISDRVHFVRGGKLAGLLGDARSAVTVNSTAGQQALWRGIPLRAFGAAVYAKPELVSDQTMVEFFRTPRPPDAEAYTQFRDFLLATSQMPGSFYASKGRRQLVRRVTDMMLGKQDPYSQTRTKSEALRQQLRVVG